MAAGAAAAGLLTACSSADRGDGGTSGGPAAAAARAVRAENALRLRSAATSRGLLGQYDAVLERHPGQSARLTPLRAAVVLHIAALTPKERHSKEPSPTASATTAAPDPAGVEPVTAVAADPAGALAALSAAERRTADAHTAALLQAPPELARLLASLAAASAAHAYLLTEGSRS
ncbi:hypothetical protein [Streptomyces sp. NPDC051569]|uniref:hypothetical protein n=1 Tax=Streptomyces sp. NPDC051569 TaxID=3365661 RepID=UPI00379FAE9B